MRQICFDDESVTYSIGNYHLQQYYYLSCKMGSVKVSKTRITRRNTPKPVRFALVICILSPPLLESCFVQVSKSLQPEFGKEVTSLLNAQLDTLEA